jgi:hypothetical protein
MRNINAFASCFIIIACLLWRGNLVAEDAAQVPIETTNTKNTTSIEFKAVDYRQETVKDSIPKQETRILSPPYQIFQVGGFRTATTFQFELLCSIAMWKSNSEIPCKFINTINLKGKRFQRRLLLDIEFNRSFVYKAHDDAGILNDLSDQIAIFSSGEVGSQYALYTQSLDNIRRCSTCEIKHYVPFFQLSPDESSELERHMSLFGILRQCCGLQMSKYEMLRLHGCDVTKYVDLPGYPNCERYSHNMSDIETAFNNSPVPFQSNNPKYNWARPGDCQRFHNEIVSEGLGFNGFPFPGCDEMWKDTKYQPEMST